MESRGRPARLWPDCVVAAEHLEAWYAARSGGPAAADPTPVVLLIAAALHDQARAADVRDVGRLWLATPNGRGALWALQRDLTLALQRAPVEGRHEAARRRLLVLRSSDLFAHTRRDAVEVVHAHVAAARHRGPGGVRVQDRVGGGTGD